jgi:hypothetical protein
MLVVQEVSIFFLLINQIPLAAKKIEVDLTKSVEEPAIGDSRKKDTEREK